MVFKKNNPGCGAGGGCGCDSRPCCSTVWDYVRADYTTVTLTLNGTDGGYAPSDPMVTDDDFAETVGSPPFLFYQCGFGLELIEPWETHSPPPAPYREAFEQPGTSPPELIYAQGFISLDVLDCIPTPELEVIAVLRYSWWPGSDPTATLTGAGYTLDTLYTDSMGRDRYYQTSGYITDEVLYLPASHQCWITVTYSRTLTVLADILTAIPNPLTLAPAFNPHPMSLDVDFS